MPVLDASEIAEVVGGTLVNARPGQRFSDYHFDSRQLADGGLFFALRTASADGHDYLPQVARMRGTGAVVSRSFPHRDPTLPLRGVDHIVVQQLALAIETDQFTARAKTRINGQYILLPQGRGQQ